MFYIIYPEARRISDGRMLAWAEDAIANGEIEGPVTLSVPELANQLEDAGLIELSRGLTEEEFEAKRTQEILEQEMEWAGEVF